MQKKNVCITGINGFIGRNVALALLEAGHEICGIDRTDKPFDSRIGYMQGDITDATTADALFANFYPAVLVHLAALVHKAEQDLSLERYRKINAAASERLFKAALKAGVRDILFSSTIEVYGSPNVAVVDESTPCNPLSYYAKSKLEAEEALLRLVGEERALFPEKKLCKKSNTDDHPIASEIQGACPLAARDRSPSHALAPLRYAILRFAPVYAADFRLNLDKRFYLPGKRAAYVFKDGGYSFHFCAVQNVYGFIVRYLEGNAESGTYIVSDAKPVVAREFIALEKAVAENAGKKLRVVRMPYALSFAAIACAEGVFRLFSRSEPFLSRYNFRKLFKSVVYSSAKAWSAVGAPQAGIGSLYTDATPMGEQNG